MAPKQSFGERHAARKKSAGRGRMMALVLVAVLVVGWAGFALMAVSSLGDVPGGVVQEVEGLVSASVALAAGSAEVRLENAAELERDVRTGLMVPRFWEPSAQLSSNVEDFIQKDENGDDTIFVMIASYRDFQCRETVTSALSRASKPGRVVIAVVQQNSDGDVPCNEPIKPCSEDPTQVLCSRQHQVKVYEMDAAEATGPVYARHVGNRMYRGEAFAMQVDAHVQFVNDWDVSLEAQWQSTGNEMAVLSTYLTDVQGSLDANGDSLRTTRPIMCNSAFEGQFPARYLRHGAQPEEEPAVHGSPMMQPFWAAGMSFARGHFVFRVPYDCCLPMVFMGEEISMGIRGWTHGYDMYTLESSVVFHEYAVNSGRRRHVHMFWENGGKSKTSGKASGSSTASLKRLTAIIGMAPEVAAANDYDQTEDKRYGLGNVRDVAQFYKTFLVDVEHRTSAPLCKFVKTGVMHVEFSKFLRADRRGVDYMQLEHYDTAAAILTELDTNWRPKARQGLYKALEMGSVGWLANALDEAKRAELATTDPDLVLQVQNALAQAKRAKRS